MRILGIDPGLTRCGVGIVDLESLADQVVGKVDLRAHQEIERHRIDQHRGAVALQHQVVIHAGGVEREIVLEAGTAAAGHRQPQHGAGRLFRDDGGNALGGAGGKGGGHGTHQETLAIRGLQSM